MNLSCALFKLRPFRPDHAKRAVLNLSTTALFGLLLGATPLCADIATDATPLLEMWAPESVAYQSATLTIILPQDRITDQIYLSVIKFGLCMAPLQGVDLLAVETIEILNRHAAQGLVYERGLSDCTAFNERPASDRTTDVEILGNTHWYP